MHKAFIYAETAFHHEGDLDYLLKLIDNAAEAGVDGIKFQVLINLNELISQHNPAFYKLRNYVFTLEHWKKIFKHAINVGLSIIVMPLDIESFSLLDNFENHITFLELHSVSFNDIQIKERIKKSKFDLIVGAGGRKKAEIQEAIDYFGGQVKVLMVGFQSFPSQIQDIRLRRIKEIQKDFTGLVVGYADHSSFDDQWAVESNSIAYALGATVIEKHLTLSEGEKRVDYESAIGIEKLKQIKSNLDNLFAILYAYPDPYELTPAEVNYRNRQKMVVASKNLQIGEVIKKDDIALKMVGRFDGFSKFNEVIGKTLKNPITADFLVRPEDVNS
jgi:N,N'-diacetyllegionaminate synthase